MMSSISPESEPLLPLARILAEIAARAAAEECSAADAKAVPFEKVTLRQFANPPILFKPGASPSTKLATSGEVGGKEECRVQDSDFQ